MRHVVAYASEEEVRGIFHNGKIDTPLHITINEIGFTQPQPPIKTNKSTSKVIVTATSRQKRSK